MGADRRRASVQRRRGMVLVGATMALCAGLLAAWLPTSALVHQREAIAAVSAQLQRLHRQDQALQREEAALSNPAVASRLASQQYELSAPGEQLYQVLPPASGAGTYRGDPGLQPPVAPTGQGEVPPALTGAAGPSSHGNQSSTARGDKATGGTAGGSATLSTLHRSTAGSQPGYWQRVEQTLEFWK